MPDGGDQRVNQEVDVHVAVGKVAKALPFTPPGGGYTAGGGGEGGHFAISSLEELETFKNRWQAIVDKMDLSQLELRSALDNVEAPADDGPSKYEAQKTLESLEAAIAHNAAMRKYAQGYVDKLAATAADYTATEGDNAADLNKSGA